MTSTPPGEMRGLGDGAAARCCPLCHQQPGHLHYVDCPTVRRGKSIVEALFNAGFRRIRFFGYDENAAASPPAPSRET